MNSEFAIVLHDEVAGILETAKSHNTPTLTLSTGGRVDRQTFIAAVRESLPLDPPLESSRSWDALSDSLWEGLHRLKAPRLVLVWTDAGTAEGHEQDFQIALWVLCDLVEGLADAEATVGEPTQLSIYVAVSAETELVARHLLQQRYA